MDNGYTKRWRKRWDKGYHKDLLLWAMMDYFIDFANWQDREFPFFWNGSLSHMVKLKRGQCFFTYQGLAEFFESPEAAVSRKMVKSRTLKLTKLGFLGHVEGRLYQVVTVLNYDKYNPLPDTEGHVKGHVGAMWGPSEGHVRAIPNKLNNIKKVNKGIYICADFSLDEKLSKYALEHDIAPGKLDELLKSFIDYHVEKKTKAKSWDRSWYTWVRNAPEFSKWAMRKSGSGALSPKGQNNLEILNGGLTDEQ